jgi:hypothetical protein
VIFALQAASQADCPGSEDALAFQHTQQIQLRGTGPPFPIRIGADSHHGLTDRNASDEIEAGHILQLQICEDYVKSRRTFFKQLNCLLTADR